MAWMYMRGSNLCASYVYSGAVDEEGATFEPAFVGFAAVHFDLREMPALLSRRFQYLLVLEKGPA